MRGKLKWLRRFGWVIDSSSTSRHRSFSVERLEPRQMLAADCFFIVEASPHEANPGDEGLCDEFVESWQLRDSSLPAFESTSFQTDDPSEDHFEDYYLIHLEDVIDEIGELFEVQDTSWGDFDSGELEDAFWLS
jgi:hypothetical protein